MAKVTDGRMTADIEGDFVVFLIGMRINKLWKVHKWFPVAMAMPGMQRQQLTDPELGMLGQHQWFTGRRTLLVQYWRSAEHLDRFARDPELRHRPAWKAYNRAIGTGGDVGVWHETYLVKAGEYETIYANMPLFGLATAGSHMPVARKGDSARERRTHTSAA
jgi:Monooxygenase af470-like